MQLRLEGQAPIVPQLSSQGQALRTACWANRCLTSTCKGCLLALRLRSAQHKLFGVASINVMMCWSIPTWRSAV